PAAGYGAADGQRYRPATHFLPCAEGKGAVLRTAGTQRSRYSDDRSLRGWWPRVQLRADVHAVARQASPHRDSGRNYCTNPPKDERYAWRYIDAAIGA